MTTATDELRIELAFSRALVESPDFVRIARRTFNRELAHYTDTSVAEDELAEEKIRTAWLKQQLAERDAELADREQFIGQLLQELSGTQ